MPSPLAQFPKERFTVQGSWSANVARIVVLSLALVVSGTALLFFLGIIFINGGWGHIFAAICFVPVSIITYMLVTGRVPGWLRWERIYGTPGDLSDARGKFSDANIAAGEAGEKKTAELLNALAVIPGTRVYHGVRWPESETADIDHIVLNGETIMLIDSKSWSGERHELQLGAKQVISHHADGTTKIRDIKMGSAIWAMRKAFPKAEVLGYLAIHSPDATYEIPDELDADLLSDIGDAADIVEHINSLLCVNTTGRLDVALAKGIHALLK